MKLVNKDVTYLFEMDTDEILGPTYRNELKYQGGKQHMRLRWSRGRVPHMEWYDERPGGAGNYEWKNVNNRVYGHINKWVGRKFDDCFSDLKNKVLRNPDWKRQAGGFGTSKGNGKVLWMAYRDRFLRAFEKKSWYSPEYFVDDEGIIRVIPSKPRHSKNITILEGEAYFKPNWGAIKLFSSAFGDARVNLLEYLRSSDKVSIDLMHRWENSFRNIGYWEVRSIRNACFEFVDNRIKRIIKAGTKEWYEHKRRTNRIKRSKPDRSIEFDRSLWAQRYLKKHPNCGMGFHALLNYDIEEIKRDQFIETFKSVFKDPQSWTVPWGCTRKELWNAFKELLDEKYYVTNWIRNGFSNNFVVAELEYRIAKNRKQNDLTRSKQKNTKHIEG